MDDIAAFSTMIETLRPWHASVAVVGGWAHRLHRLHVGARPPHYQPLLTRDADVAFGDAPAPTGDIGGALQQAGFRKDLTGDHIPPVTQFRLSEEDHGFYVEFLAPLRGSGTKRNGQPDATIERAGVTAQKLRYLDLLLASPWTVVLDSKGGFPVAKPQSVRIANAASFIAHKLLISDVRPPRKRAQDILYIHDTLDLFGSALAALHTIWVEVLRATLPRKAVGRVESAHRDQFASVNDIIRDAARIPHDRSLTPERIQLACALGLEQIFSSPVRPLYDSRCARRRDPLH